MKKTYNVCSKVHALKFLSVMFFFTLFFLGMSSSVSAQSYSTSRASAGTSVDADFSITLKAVPSPPPARRDGIASHVSALPAYIGHAS